MVWANDLYHLKNGTTAHYVRVSTQQRPSIMCQESPLRLRFLGHIYLNAQRCDISCGWLTNSRWSHMGVIEWDQLLLKVAVLYYHHHRTNMSFINKLMKTAVLCMITPPPFGIYWNHGIFKLLTSLRFILWIRQSETNRVNTKFIHIHT